MGADFIEWTVAETKKGECTEWWLGLLGGGCMGMVSKEGERRRERKFFFFNNTASLSAEFPHLREVIFKIIENLF